jgi:protein SCO1
MRIHLRSAIGLAALLITAATLLVSAPAFAAEVGEPGWFPNVPLTTHEGKVVRFYDDLLKGKSVVINLIYTSCTYSCPIETAKMAELQRILGDRVGKDIFFYSISIDPDNDTPKKLKAYATQFKAKPGWLFLTGKDADIQLISKQLGLSSLGDTATPDGHMPSLMIGNEPTNQWMRNSAVDNPKFLATTILHFFDGYSAKKHPSYASLKPLPSVDTGEYLFQSRCALCHTIGKGDRVGPDLLNVHKRRDPTWLARYVAAPERLYAAGDAIAKALFAKYPTVRMPNLNLSAEEVSLILPYIEQQSRAAAKAPAKTKAAAK